MLQISLVCMHLVLQGTRLVMGLQKTFLGTEEIYQDDDEFSTNDSKDLAVTEDGVLALKTLDLKMLLELILKEIHVITMDTKQSSIEQRYILPSYFQYFQCQYNKEVGIPPLTNLFNLRKTSVKNSSKLLTSESCHWNPQFNVCPLDFSSKVEELLNNSVIEMTWEGDLGTLIITPIFQRIVGNIEMSMMRNAMKSRASYHLGTLENTDVNIRRETMSSDEQIKCSELVKSDSEINVTPDNAIMETKKNDADIVEKVFDPPFDTDSVYFFQPTSSHHITFSKGLFRFIWRNDIPFFMFLSDDQSEIYAASPWKTDYSEEKALDYVYLFHSKTDGKKMQGDFMDNTPNLVGKMKVSSSVTLSSKSLKLMETEFVLFSGNKKHVVQKIGSRSFPMKNMANLRKVTNIIRTNTSSKYKSKHKFSTSWDKFGIYFPESYLESIRKLNSIERDYVNDPLQTNLELSAIVVKNYIHSKNSEATPAIGGWGLKFLEKTKSQKPNSYSFETFQSSSATSVSVIIPNGVHGGPRRNIGGPSSLLERWKSGGRCDCGGWDMGCPLTVLSDNPGDSQKLTPENNYEGHKPFELFTEGAKTGWPLFKMVKVQDGLYSIIFQPTLSAFQSFAICISIVHTRSPSLCPHPLRI